MARGVCALQSSSLSSDDHFHFRFHFLISNFSFLISSFLLLVQPLSGTAELAVALRMVGCGHEMYNIKVGRAPHIRFVWHGWGWCS